MTLLHSYLFILIYHKNREVIKNKQQKSDNCGATVAQAKLNAVVKVTRIIYGDLAYSL